MSTESSPGVSGHPAPHAGPPGHSDSDFFAWVRGLGVVRGTDRWAGGVASGLARRWRVDPILVRGLFIIIGIFPGVGLLAYGVLWMILPEPDGRIHLQDAMHGRWTGGMTGGLVTTIVGLGGAPAVWFGDARWSGPFWIVLWFGVAFLIVYGISASRRARGAGSASFAGGGLLGAQVPPARPHPPEGAVPVQTPFSVAEPPAGARAPYGYPGSPVPPPMPAPQPHLVRPHRHSPSGPFVAVVMGVAVFVPGVLLAI